MANLHIKRCSTLLTIREIKTKITMIHHFTPTSIAIKKKEREKSIEIMWTKWNLCTLLVGM